MKIFLKINSRQARVLFRLYAYNVYKVGAQVANRMLDNE